MNLFACARFEVKSVKMQPVGPRMLKGSTYLSRQQDCAHSQPPQLPVLARSAARFERGGGLFFAALNLERKVAAMCSSSRDWSII